MAIESICPWHTQVVLECSQFTWAGDGIRFGSWGDVERSVARAMGVVLGVKKALEVKKAATRRLCSFVSLALPCFLLAG